MAQANIDSLIAGLHNNDVRSVVESVAPSKASDSGRLYVHTWERILTSINVRRVRMSFPREVLVKRLAVLLDDSDKDWYAGDVDSERLIWSKFAQKTRCPDVAQIRFR
jgi:hypothetical protein